MPTIDFPHQIQTDGFTAVKSDLCSQFYSEQRHYLRMPVIYDSAKLDLSVINTLKQIRQPAAIFVYQDSELDPELDSDGRVAEIFFPVESNEEPAQIEEEVICAIASLPADLLLCEVITESEFLEFKQALSPYRVE